MYKYNNLTLSPIDLVHDLHENGVWYTARCLLNVCANQVVRFLLVQGERVRQGQILVQLLHAINACRICVEWVKRTNCSSCRTVQIQM